MTLPTTTSAVTYAGNGVTTQFDWTFPIPSGALAVYRTENNVAVLVDPSAYSVSGLHDPNGGTVSFAQAPALGQTITIKRNVGLTQDMALVTGSAFYAEVVEGAFDHATMQIQQLAEEVGRAVQVPIGSGLDPADYLDAAARSAATAAAAAGSAAGSAGAAADSVIAAAAAQSGSETARNEAEAAVAAIVLPLPIESGGTGATTAAAARVNLGVVEAPVGSLLFQSARETHVQPGYILGNGAPVTETYPELRALYIADGYPYGQDEYGNPLTPNYPGYGLRGWLPGQLVDSGRIWGSKQEDALQGHKHRTPAADNGGAAWAELDGREANTTPSVSYTVTATGRRLLTGGVDFSDGVNGTPRVADETRMKNMPVVIWIKAYPANTDPGSIDLANLTNDIQAVSARATALENRLGYTVLYPSGTETAPATISNNQRVAIANPYGNAPCLVEAEIKRGDAWGITGWYADNAGSSDGARASVLGEQIVIQSGSRSVCHNSVVAGNGFGLTGAVTSAPYRVKVWKLAGA